MSFQTYATGSSPPQTAWQGDRALGLCGCGCGQPAPIAKQTDVRRGHIKGECLRFISGHNLGFGSLIERFWSKINKDSNVLPSDTSIAIYPEIRNTACWLWTATTDACGYGRLSVGKRLVGAHRTAWFIETGHWSKQCVLHKCDNPACARFSHLFEGTDKDNSKDREDKGRGAIRSGENNGRAKLTALQVSAIKKSITLGEHSTTLAAKYKVHKSTIADIKAGRHWKEDTCHI